MTPQLDDFAQAVRADRRLVAAGMKDVVGVVESIAAETAQQQAEGKQAASAAAEDGMEEEGADVSWIVFLGVPEMVSKTHRKA